VSVRVFSGEAIRQAVSPVAAYEAVREAFVAHATGAWTMQPKVYVTNYPSGDFRAMPALGGGYALLKWVTSFPGNPARGLPTVSGLVLLSDAETGALVAVLDAATVTSLRTAAAGVLAADVLGTGGATAVVGCGVNGAETVRLLVALGKATLVYDRDPTRAATVAYDHGATAVTLAEALAADAVITVTPGKEILFAPGTLRDGQHVSLMGADGPGKAEIATSELLRGRLFCDDWEQASHGGETAHAVEAGGIGQDGVTELGKVLTGEVPGRQHADDTTLFDSTGLAIQDLAISIAANSKAGELDLPRLEL
jgi:alanine dehydrogenase